MGQDQFKTTLVGLVLFILFTTLILTVAIDFGADNGRTASEIGGGSLNLSLFEDTTSTVEEDAQGYYSRFTSGDVDDVDDPSGVFSVATDMVFMITTPFKLLATVMVNMLNIPPIFAYVVLGLLVISILLAIWSLLRKGD